MVLVSHVKKREKRGGWTKMPYGITATKRQEFIKGAGLGIILQ